MKQRGRKSAAKLAVVEQTIETRPKAPDTLTDSEKTLWNAITASRQCDFFDEATLPLLREYCRLHTAVERCAAQLNDFDDGWLSTDEGVKRFRNLENVRDQKQGRMVALARAMRLTQQARYVPDKAKNRPVRPKTAKVWQRES